MKLKSKLKVRNKINILFMEKHLRNKHPQYQSISDQSKHHECRKECSDEIVKRSGWLWLSEPVLRNYRQIYRWHIPTEKTHRLLLTAAMKITFLHFIHDIFLEIFQIFSRFYQFQLTALLDEWP